MSRVHSCNVKRLIIKQKSVLEAWCHLRFGNLKVIDQYPHWLIPTSPLVRQNHKKCCHPHDIKKEPVALNCRRLESTARALWLQQEVGKVFANQMAALMIQFHYQNELPTLEQLFSEIRLVLRLLADCKNLAGLWVMQVFYWLCLLSLKSVPHSLGLITMRGFADTLVVATLCADKQSGEGKAWW